MKLNELAEKVGAKVINHERCANIEIDRIYAGDKMSDLLNEASDTTLLVTNLAHPQLVRMTEIMDVPGICLLNDIVLDPKLVSAAIKYGTTIMVSPYDMFETCKRLDQCLAKQTVHS